MTRRLLIPLLSLITVVLLSLGVPLAAGKAREVASTLFLDRLGDATRLASIAAQSSQDADRRLLEQELVRYDGLYGISAALLGRDGTVLVASRRDFEMPGTARGDWLPVALGGLRPSPPETIWPWESEPLVVAEPVVSGGDVIGAIVTSSPVDKAQQLVWRQWALLALIMLGALAVGLTLAVALARWILRPVRSLDHVTHKIATGQLAARVPVERGPIELRRLSASINEMADSVSALVRQQRSFVADASHQLRNQLHALMLRLDAVSMTLPPEYREDADEAAEEGRRLTTMLDRLLDLAAAEHAPAQAGRFDLLGTVRERMLSWEAAADARDITIALKPRPARSVLISGDEIAVSGALDVLLDNAIKYSPPGSVVRLSIVDDDVGPVRIEVRDNGSGLAADEWVHVGDRFWRSRRHQNVDGTGLGLSVARALLMPSGSRLSLTPAPDGRGILATITLGSTDDHATASSLGTIPEPLGASAMARR